MVSASKLLPLLKNKKVEHFLTGLFVCLVLLTAALGTMTTGHNVQWYGSNTVSSAFAPLVMSVEQKLDAGTLNTNLLYSAYITLFDNVSDSDKSRVRQDLISCFYETVQYKDDKGKTCRMMRAISDTDKVFTRIEDKFHITISSTERQYMVSLAQIFTGGKSYVLSGNVTEYNTAISQYCQKYGISGYVPLVEAVMQQESGGSGGDPMQCSEGPCNTQYPNKPNGITDPAYSIRCGVQELAGCLRAAECKSPDDTPGISLALQGYNFGNGYISWALKKGGYSAKNAAEFSQMEARKLGWSGYGDVNYVNHVLRYYSVLGGGSAGKGSFASPIAKGQFTISSGFGERIDPVSGGKKFHRGVDMAAPYGTPICAGADGTVIYAQYGAKAYSGYGNVVVIRHSSSLVSLYGHCSRLLVSSGQAVRKGQVIAEVGSTGKSTGNHCHFEIRVNGSSVNPLPYLA